MGCAVPPAGSRYLLATTLSALLLAGTLLCTRNGRQPTVPAWTRLHMVVHQLWPSLSWAQ